MTRKKHKTLLWLAVVAAAAVVGAVVLARTSVGESVKRESAQLFKLAFFSTLLPPIATSMEEGFCLLQRKAN